MQLKFLFILIGIICLFTESSCDRDKNVSSEGYIGVEGGNIWYKIVGTGNKIPVLVMHGGPGSRSCTMIPGLSPLGMDRQVIFYDQLGSGNSDRPTDTSLWRIERFVDEIDVLRQALKLNEVHMLGHSCGGTFLMEYLVTKKPKGIKSVIFSSPMLSTETWINDAKILLNTLPQSIQDTISKYEQLGEYSSSSYLAATDTFYSQYLTRKSWPYEKTTECENVLGFNEQVYNYMWGPTEFTATGTLKNFDRTAEIPDIAEPILFITGEHDEARPETMREFQKLAQEAQLRIVKEAAHMTMVDQPERVVKYISSFLDSVESR